MDKQTISKTYPTEVLLSITTGRLLCNFSDMHECCEFLVSQPIWTHEFASKGRVEQLKAAVLAQYPEFATVDAEGVTKDNWQEFKARMIEQFGAEKEISATPQAVEG